MRYIGTLRLALTLARRWRSDATLRKGLRYYEKRHAWPKIRTDSSAQKSQSSRKKGNANHRLAPTLLPPRRVVLGELARGSNTFDLLRTGPTAPRVNLVLPGLDIGRVYAGLKTALRAGAYLSEQSGMPLRIITLSELHANGDLDDVRRWLTENVGAEVVVDSVIPPSQIHQTVVSDEDLWVVTHWTTAYAAGHLVRTSALDPRRVAYLIQDFEPAFNPWGDQYALAESTYGIGYFPLVNSLPLAKYLRSAIGVAVDEKQVFAPDLEFGPLKAAAETWRPTADNTVRMLFYARPRHPRNLFRVGVQGLQVFANRLDDLGVTAELFSAGDVHQDVELSKGIVLRSLGKLSHPEYYRLLANVDIGLALMNSPHPSHLPLELSSAGIPTVTNTMGIYRDSWNQNIILADRAPESISAALEDALRIHRSVDLHRFSEPLGLGGSLQDAISFALESLRTGRPAPT